MKDTKIKKEYNRYTSLMIKKDLKMMMDDKIKELGIEMSYSALIKYLIKIDKNEKM